MTRRALIIVIDSMGIGAMRDAASFGDRPSCNTLANVAAWNGGLSLPVLQSLGLGNLATIAGVPPTELPRACYGVLEEASRGKDTTTGHWEIAGLVLNTPFEVFPQGFPAPLMEAFVKEANCGGYLGNVPASGTEIIAKHNAAHKATGFPIIYTSADSVFQIACNTDAVGCETLYSWCQIARDLLDRHHNVSRVIARPYAELPDGGLKRLSGDRRDYSVPPPPGSVLETIAATGGMVLGIGKIEDIFLGRGVTHSIHTGGNTDGLEKLLAVLEGSIAIEDHRIADVPSCPEASELVFVNLVDTDSLYGHRNDADGYGRALEEIDRALDRMLRLLGPDDLLIVTADHGCDPTEPGTDHTRERVPLLAYGPTVSPRPIGARPAFTYIARMVAEWLGVPARSNWAA